MDKGGTMEILAKLTPEEQLAVRCVEAAELRAYNKVHQFKERVEAEFAALQADARIKTAATVAHLGELTKKYKLNVETVGFDFEALVFYAKPVPDGGPSA